MRGVQQMSQEDQPVLCGKASFIVWLKLSFLVYEQHLPKYLQEKVEKDSPQMGDLLQSVSRCPGYKPIQIIFAYHLLNHNMLAAALLALLYPLPCVLIFIAGSNYGLEVPQVGLICLIGVRCTVIALMCRYCLHFPSDKYNWAVYVGTIFVGAVFRNNYVFLLLLFISIFLAYYLKEDAISEYTTSLLPDDRESCFTFPDQNRGNPIPEKVMRREDVPETYGSYAIIALMGLFVLFWFLSKSTDEYSSLMQIFFVGMLSSTMQASAFYPYLLTGSVPGHTYTGNYLGLSYLLPGPNTKSYFALSSDPEWIFLAYIALYVPSVLLGCVFYSFRKQFEGVLWENIRGSLQIVTNSLCLVTAVSLLREQYCNWNVVCYTSVVLVVVSKLYKFHELPTMALGVFLVFSRATVLYIYKGEKRYDQFLCLSD